MMDWKEIEKLLDGLPYEEYLLTTHWQETRKRKLDQSHHKCELCGGNGGSLEVHHNSYEHLWREPMCDLVVLCPDCHERHHNVLPSHDGHAGMVCPHCGRELVASIRLEGV